MAVEMIPEERARFRGDLPSHVRSLMNEVFQDKVFQSLDQAVSNGFDLHTWTAEDIVYDLIAYSSDFDEPPEDNMKVHMERLIPVVKLWLSQCPLKNNNWITEGF